MAIACARRIDPLRPRANAHPSVARARTSGFARRVPAGGLGAALAVALAVGVSACAGIGERGPVIWRYSVQVADGGERIAVEAVLPRGAGEALVLDARGVDAVRDLEVAQRGEWRVVGAGAAMASGLFEWPLPAAIDGDRELRVRYRFELADAVRAADDRGIAWSAHGVIALAPSLWLVRPHAGASTELRLAVDTPPGLWFASGAECCDETGGSGTAAGPAAHVHRLDPRRIGRAPVGLFGALDARDIAVDGGVIELVWPRGARGFDADAVARWIEQSARAVGAWYGRFPVRRVVVFAYPSGRGLPGFARAFGHGGAFVDAPIGARSARPTLGRQWVMTHELAHLGFPNVPTAHRWLEEGLATYVEHVARVRAGALDEREFWRELRRGLPLGQPRDGDRGLDHTPTWGRTYWGGALFCFVADVAIRRRTGGRLGLEHALRGLVAAGGTIEVAWDVERALRTADAATGVPVLSELYAAWKATPVTVDLEALWRALGVPGSRDAPLDDAAPEAALRRALTALDPASVAIRAVERAPPRDRAGEPTTGAGR